MVRLSALVALALVAVLGAFTVRVSGTPVLPATPYDYDGIALPSYLDVPPIRGEDNTPASNPVTDAGATLGRVLFYDTRLSANETVSCASCHRAEHGFSDPAVRSVGVDGGLTGRHSMSLAFSRYYLSGRFFWDERAPTLEEQVLMPIQDAVEMALTLPEATARLEATTFYPGLFADAFGTPDVTPERMARALAQFVRTMAPADSPYDRARQQQGGPPGRPLPGFTAQQNQGLGLFFGRAQCSACHRGDLFTGDQPRNNGLDATVTDAGAGGGRFKVGSLRNVALTAPYMHDGRVATLDAVVEHYNSGVQNSPTLDPRLRTPGGQPLRLNLSAAEKAALVAFLETLTDGSIATDPRWSDPFAITTASPPAEPASQLTLELAGPNPVRTTTALRVGGAGGASVTAEVFALTGRRVAVLHDGPLADTTLRWDTAGLAAGVYTVRVRAGGAAAVQTLTVVR